MSKRTSRFSDWQHYFAF